MKLKSIDYIVIILAIAVCVGAIVIISTQARATTQLVIETPDGKWVYPLDTNRVIRVKGAIGGSVIEIRDGEAFFTESVCDNKTCVLSPPLQKPGHWSACLPNRVFAYIEGNDDRKLDIVGF